MNTHRGRRTLTVAGAVSVTGSKGKGFSGSLAAAGVGTANTIAIDIHSSIRNNSTTQ